MAIAALELADLGVLADELRPRAEPTRDQHPTLLDLALFRRGILGSIADALLSDLPSNPQELARHLERRGHDDEQVEAAVAKATREAVQAAHDYYKRATERTFGFFG